MPNGTLVNTGTIRSTTGARNGPRTLRGDVDNQGTIAAVNQNLNYSGAFTLTSDASGVFQVNDGRVISLNAGTMTVLGSGTTFVATATGRVNVAGNLTMASDCLLYTSPSPRDVEESRMPSSA